MDRVLQILNHSHGPTWPGHSALSSLPLSQKAKPEKMLTSKKFTWGCDSREAERKGTRDSKMGKHDQGRVMKVVFYGGNCSSILPGSFEVPGPLRLRVMGEDLFISSHSPLVTGCSRGWYLSTSRCVQKPREQSRTYRRPPTRQLQVQWYRPHLLSWSSDGQSYRRTRPRRCRCYGTHPPRHTHSASLSSSLLFSLSLAVLRQTRHHLP